MARVHVLGAGSIGLQWAHLLRSAGVPVTLLLKAEVAVQRFGAEGGVIMLETASGQLTQQQAQAETSSCSPMAGSSAIDTLIVATKAHAVTAAVEGVRHRLRPGSTLVLLQNGVLSVYEELHRKVLGAMHEAGQLPRIVIGTTTHGCFTRSPFHVVHAGVGRCLLAAVPDPRRPTLLPQDWQILPAAAATSSGAPAAVATDIGAGGGTDAVMQTHGTPMALLPSASAAAASSGGVGVADGRTAEIMQRLVEVPGLNAAIAPSFDNFIQQLHVKLAVSCCINPLTALSGCKNGKLVGQADMEDMMGSVCRELCMVLPPGLGGLSPEQLLQQVLQVARDTAGNTSSMLQDVLAGRQTEAEYLSGYVLRRAAANGTQAPTLATLHRLVIARSVQASSE